MEPTTPIKDSEFIGIKYIDTQIKLLTIHSVDILIFFDR
jgi:hypothetical protein